MLSNKTVLLTGSQGFIGGYLAKLLLAKGYTVVGVDDYSKYGYIKREHDNHPNFVLREMDLSKSRLYMRHGVDYIIAGAAMIGGISYFHKYAYDLLATNERIMANTFDMAIDIHKEGNLKRIVVISSSMVYEGADAERDKIDDMATMSCCGPENFEDPNNVWPSEEGSELYLPPPHSTYGLQKLACEYFCKGAAAQYGVPYTIVRPFNCVGLGEEEALGEEEVLSGNVKLLMSHVLPDLVKKTLEGQDPLHILGAGNQIRCYTHGRDVARGIVMAMESNAALNEDFNIAIARQTTVKELATLVWNEVHGDSRPLTFTSDAPYMHDVQKRVPNVDKAKKLLGFEAEVSLEESVKEVVDHMRRRHVSNSA